MIQAGIRSPQAEPRSDGAVHSEPPDRLLAILNPSAGKGRAMRLRSRLEALWAARGLDVEIAETDEPEHATALAAEAVESGWPAVVAVGGDGTVHEVGSGLLRAAAGKPTVPLGVVPVGSGNDFVTALGTPTDPLTAADALCSATPRRVDAGRVNERFFVNGVGAGFDARVAIRARGIPLLRGTALYGLALLRELGSQRTPRVSVVLDGREIVRGPITLITSSNGPSCGGGFRLCPEARIDDGELDVLVVEALPRRAVLAFLLRSLEGRHLGRDGMHLHRGRRVEITSDEPVAVHADGEIVDAEARRIEIEILPRRLTVLA